MPIIFIAMASLWSFMVFMACFSSLALSSSSQLHVQHSTISAAPALLPSTAPLSSSPSLPPDIIEPLFPTPKAMAPSPTDSSLPTIPSSPSPPNPDNILAPGPGFALSPSGSSFPSSNSVSLTSAGPLKSTLFLGLLLVVLCLLQQFSGV